MKNETNQKLQAVFDKRKKMLSEFLGKPLDSLVERFLADLLGCLSGGSNERDRARDWLLFCFYQYFGSGDFDKDDIRVEELRELLYSFSEPTAQELEID